MVITTPTPLSGPSGILAALQYNSMYFPSTALFATGQVDDSSGVTLLTGVYSPTAATYLYYVGIQPIVSSGNTVDIRPYPYSLTGAVDI